MQEDSHSAEPSRKKNVAKMGAAAVAVAAAVGFYAFAHDESGAAKNAPKEEVNTAQAVTVERASRQPFSREVGLAGEVRPRRDVRVFSPAAQTRVLQLLVDEGDFVRAGQPLARLDANLAAAQIAAAEASVKEADVAALRARSEYERAESIKDSGALSAEAIGARKAAADAADARLNAAKAQLAEVNARLQGGYIRAPDSGLVIERVAEIGQLVDGQLLFRIAADNVLEVAVEVSETDMLALREGQPATFTMVDGTSVQATLRRPPASLDTKTRTGQALFALSKHPKLRAGMYLRGTSGIAAQDQVGIPQSAVLYDESRPFVYVVDDSNHARKTPVTLGGREGDRLAVLSGLSEGARVVSSSAAFLQDGDEVRAVEAAAAAPSADLRARSGG